MNAHIARYFSFIGSSAIAAASLVACGGGNVDTTPPTVLLGTIAVSAMTNAPACGFDAVNVTISKVRFHTNFNAAPDASGWVELAFAKKINLLNLATVLGGATTDLGAVSLPVGNYTQMRLVLDANTSGTANTVKLAGASAELALETGTALTAGYKMPIDLTVASGGTASAVLDFDACGSIQTRGTTYVLKPRARIIPAALNGISGFISTAMLSSKVVITAQQNGGIVTTTSPNSTTGEFLLPRLPAGNYDVVINADAKASAVIGAVPVAATGATAVSTAAAPITLATSAVSAITGKIIYTLPAVAPDDGTWASASQIIAANTTVGNVATTITYRFQPADVSSGAYAFNNLPRASVQFALYKSTLPLTLAAATTSLTTGHYLVQAIASGFSNKVTTVAVGTGAASNNVNVATANATLADIPMP